MSLTTEKTGEVQTWLYQGGLRDYLMQTLTADPLIPLFEGEHHADGSESENFAKGEGATWCVAFTEDGSPVRESYVNLIPTVAGGTHEAGLKDGLFNAVKGFIEMHSLLPKGVKLMPDDVFSRASFVLSAKVLDPQFQGQIKERLNSRDAVRLVSSFVRPALELWLRRAGFVDVRCVDVSRTSIEEQMWKVLVLGLRDYVEKNGFRSVVVGLSGGIDSALVAALAVDALGAKRVNGVAMPSKYSSDHSISDAQAFADATGIHFRTVPIAPMVDAYMNNLVLKGLAEENLQARVRGTTLMGISNQEGHLVLATGNKSELAVGYSTLYGDAVGGFAPIKDIYKTDVWALSRWRNEVARARGEAEPIPVNSIEKEPSAELRPGQKDTDSLPDYLLLDRVLTAYVDEDQGSAALIAAGFDEALVRRVIAMVDKAEYKRRQYPPGPKVSKRAFGKDRRLPMTSRWQEGI